ncbi:hypothetical protein ACFE04_025939 [Oxalis oulophora]
MGQGSSTSLASISFNNNNNNNNIITTTNQNKNKNNDFTLCLPDECLALIFDKLNNTQHKNTCSLVCKRWKLVESKTRQRLILITRFEISQSLTSLLTRFTSISILSLKCSRKHVSINDDVFAQLPPFLPCLKKLKLKGCLDITDGGLHAFSLHRPPLLSKLSFASCGFGSKGLISILINCVSLKHLTLKRLRNLDSSNTLLSFKFDCQLKLERLCIKDLHNARLFEQLLCVCDNSLKTLVVSRSSGNWDPVLHTSFNGRISILSEIRLENMQVGDSGLTAISKSCRELETLYLSRLTDCTDEGLSAIASSCKKLRKLHIDAWTRFGSRSIGDEGVLSIARNSANLQEIVLMGVPLTVESLVLLASNCPALDRMAICNTDSVGDNEMGVIGAKFSALKKLCIKNCPISNSGVEAVVGGCPSLVKLKVKRCRRITKAAGLVRLLRSSLVVSFDYGSMVFDGGLIMDEATPDQNPAGGRINNISSNNNNNNSNNNNTRNRRSTDVMCSSRGAQMIMSKFSRRRGDEEGSCSRRT